MSIERLTASLDLDKEAKTDTFFETEEQQVEEPKKK